MSIPHVLLALLDGAQHHGYELRNQYRVRFPAARPIASAQVYSTLARMQRDGWVTPGGTVRVAGPDRTEYRITGDGRAELRRWLAEVDDPAEFVTNPLFTKVTVALLVADEADATGYLRRQRAAHMERMREFTRRKAEPGAPVAEVLAADYALHHLDADLRWIEIALDRCTAFAEEIAR